jgi:phosphoribosylanthranilate isomerase
VQIVAHIEPTESARLARLGPHVRRIQAIHVTGDAALDFIDVYSPHIHAFLLDSGRPRKSPAVADVCPGMRGSACSLR